MFGNENNIPDKNTVALLKKRIRENSATNPEIKNWIDNNLLNADELINEGILTSKRLEEINYLSPEAHLANIRRGLYDNGKIRRLVVDNVIREDELLSIFSRSALNDILQKANEPIVIDWPEEINTLSLKEHRTDIFVLGLAGSGKSVFMSGLLYYAHKNGRLLNHIDNKHGAVYANKLIEAVKRNLVPPSNPAEYIQYMACDFNDDQEDKHPLTFVEMSGEIFMNMYFQSDEKINPRFVEYLKFPNNKVIFLAIDYFLHSYQGSQQNSDVIQSFHFDYAMQFFEKNGVLDNTIAVCILVTKWDLCPNPNQEGAAEKFLKEEYLNLIRLIRDQAKKFGFKFEIFTFSLGKFNERKGYIYNDRDSEQIFNWLCSVTYITPTKHNKGTWFSRIFK